MKTNLTAETVMRRIAKTCRENIKASFAFQGLRGVGPGAQGEARGTVETCEEILSEIHQMRRQSRR